jgi:penicillin-insensitive murein endopeptidase
MARGLWLVLCCWAGACASVGRVSDGSSLAYGMHNRGSLAAGAPLPLRGEGYLIPPTWAQRGLHYGTDELVSLVVRASRRVAAELPGATLYVGDLSPRRGGASQWHRSHQTGQDADLMFYALDEKGRPWAVPTTMPLYGRDGQTKSGSPLRLTFDLPRNWALVRALLEDPAVDVQYLFVYEPLKEGLLEHAVRIGESPELVAKAREILHQPGDSQPHNDHFHLRIYCPASDRGLGCRDRGPLRWFKKGYKYVVFTRLFEVLPSLASFRWLRPLCGWYRMASPAVAIR